MADKRVLTKAQVIKMATSNGHRLSWKRTRGAGGLMVTSGRCTQCGASASSAKTEDEGKLIITVKLRELCGS